MDRTRWTGIAAVAVLWSTQAVLIAAIGFDLVGDRTLSYLALEADPGFLFGVGLMWSAVLFVAFGRYLRHRYRLGVAFSMAMLVGMAGQFIAGVVPIGGAGTASRVHVAAALTLGASVPVLMWRFAADQPPGAWRRRCYGLFWLEVAACAMGVTLSRIQVAPLAEILPALAFHAWVAFVTIGPDDGGSLPAFQSGSGPPTGNTTGPSPTRPRMIWALAVDMLPSRCTSCLGTSKYSPSLTSTWS